MAGTFEVYEHKAGKFGRLREDVDGTPQGPDASDRLHADYCCARYLRRRDWFVEVYARAESP